MPGRRGNLRYKSTLIYKQWLTSWLAGQGLENTKIGPRERYRDGLLEMGAGGEAIFNPHECTIVKEALNNQGEQGDPFYRCQLLSPATLVIAHWAHIQCGHGGRDRGY